MRRRMTFALAIAAGLLMMCPANAYAGGKRFKAEKLDKCDPYMKAQGGYGYLVESGSKADVWWAEGVYKVMKDTPVARRKGKEVKMTSAKNEYESFIVVVNPKQDIKSLKVEFSGLPEGVDAQIRKVEYVNVWKPSDSFGYPGEWPDPLPLYDEALDAPKGENTSFWITLKTPETQPAGTYKAKLALSDADGWKVEMPVSVKVQNFSLPKRTNVSSGYGLWFWHVVNYENLKTREQQEESFYNYLDTYLDYKIAPYDPFYYAPYKLNISGIDWTGGRYDTKDAAEGKYSFIVSDGSFTANAEAVCADKLTKVDGSKAYKLTFQAKSTGPSKSAVDIDCYDANRKLMPYRSLFYDFDTDAQWKEYSMDLASLPKGTAFVHIRLFGAGYKTYGNTVGSTWYDDVRLTDTLTGANLFPQGNFEQDVNKIAIDLDFTDFNKVAAKYFGEDGFNSFVVNVEGLGGAGGNSGTRGVFCGFEFGTEEHELLMKDYLGKLQAGLEKAGVLDESYIYWGDEPLEGAYPYIREVHTLMKKYAPRIRTFMTEQITWLGKTTDYDVTDVTDISCVSWNCFDDHAKVFDYSGPGQEAWSYLCCATKYPYFTDFVDHNGIDMRLWLWASYMYGFKGILIWSATAWNTPCASPEGWLQNPWEEPDCYGTWDDKKQDFFACGDGTMFYPNNRHPNEDRTTPYTGRPVPSIRLEINRDGIEDYEYLKMLDDMIPSMSAGDARKARALLTLSEDVFMDDDATHPDKYYIQDPQFLLQRRTQIANLIEKYL